MRSAWAFRAAGCGAIALVALATLFGGPAASQEKRSAAAAATVTAGVCSNAMRLADLAGLGESSGLAVSRRTPGLLWSHNDSSDPVIYAVDVEGAARARVTVTGARVDDWEAMASGECPDGDCLFIGDIGDNGGRRKTITIYRVKEPLPSETATAPAQAFAATYPDQPHDAESLLIVDGRPYIVTKGENGPIAIYRFPAALASPGAVVGMEHVATLSQKPSKADRVTDAAISTDGKWVALRTEARLLFYKTPELLGRGTPAPVQADLSALREPQGEGVALARGGVVYLTGEGGGLKRGGTFARVSCTLPG